MAAEKRTVRTSRGPREYTCLGCPLTRNRSTWCFRLCTPDEGGHGRCGRIAPHTLRSAIQSSIEKFNQRQLESHFERLEQLYLDAPCSEYWDPGVRVSEGRAEILIPIRPQLLQAGGAVHGSVYFTALNDAAALAVGSMVEATPVVTVHFAVQIAQAHANDEIVAQARFLGPSGDHYLAEAVLTDSTGLEIARGNGAFAKGRTLAAEEGPATDGGPS